MHLLIQNFVSVLKMCSNFCSITEEHTTKSYKEFVATHMEVVF